ncbi:hypothetical protein GGH92_009295, partial [Coemansia sp. RSA 2673]
SAAAAAPEFAAAPGASSGSHVFGSPPAPAPRSLAYVDGPNVLPLSSPSSTLSSAPGAAAGPGAAAFMLRPFSRLVTDEVEKVRQEIRERERLERELRDREQAIERQKNERTKFLKRQLKEQQQRRAKNEPHCGTGGGGGSGVSVAANPSALSAVNIEENRLSSASATMRPRGPALPSAKPANVINLINSTITVEQGYTKRDFVFRIVTEEGGQYLLQAPDGEQMDDWISAMRDAATEAAARRLTLFVEEAKKRSNADGSSGLTSAASASASNAAAAAYMGLADSDPTSHQRLLGSNGDTTRSRFTAFLGGGSSGGGGIGSSAFSGFGMMGGGSHASPVPVPSRGALSALHQGKELTSASSAAGSVEPKSFGVDLALLMPDPKVVPVIVEKCLVEIELRGLEEVGIYRVSGAAADVSRLRQLFNADPDAIDLSSDEFYDINVVSGVMKQFLRELPEPLMTYNLYEGYINAASIDDYDERL